LGKYTGFIGGVQISFPPAVFIADTGKELYVWIGGGASPDEKKNAMTYAHVSPAICCSSLHVYHWLLETIG